MSVPEVEWQFGVEFPNRGTSSTKNTDAPKSTRRRKKPAIPRGSSQRLEKNVIYLHNRLQELFTYRCPLVTCHFVVRRSFNKEGALKTLMTHIESDHRKAK